MSFRLVPFTNVTISLRSSPHTISMLQAFFPFSIVLFLIDPLIQTFAISFPIFKITDISVPVSIIFESFSFPQVVNKFTFIKSSILIFHYSNTVSLAFIILPNVNRVWISFYTHIRKIDEFLEINHFTFKLVNYDPNMLNLKLIKSYRLKIKIFFWKQRCSRFIQLLWIVQVGYLMQISMFLFTSMPNRCSSHHY